MQFRDRRHSETNRTECYHWPRLLLLVLVLAGRPPITICCGPCGSPGDFFLSFFAFRFFIGQVGGCLFLLSPMLYTFFRNLFALDDNYFAAGFFFSGSVRLFLAVA